MISETLLLYIEPTRAASPVPLVDELTRRMTAAFRLAKPFKEWLGVHECVCGASSDNRDYQLPNGQVTNSLCVHYLAYHRQEVPAEQLAKLANLLQWGEAEPNPAELRAGRDTRLAELNRSYMLGEITREQYEDRKRSLGGK